MSKVDDFRPNQEVVIFQRGEERRGVMMAQLQYHAVVQGTLGGEPFCVTYCAICEGGVLLDPTVEG